MTYEEVKHGHWVCEDFCVDNGDIWRIWQCSKCGYARIKGWQDSIYNIKPSAKYCECCGAKMDEENEE